MMLLFLLALATFAFSSPLTVPIGAYPWQNSRAMDQLNGSVTDSGVHCFDQRQPYDIQLKPAQYMDCVKAAEKITFGGKAGAPMHFSRDPAAGLEVPVWWAFGSCVVRIDMKNQEDDDTFQLIGGTQHSRSEEGGSPYCVWAPATSSSKTSANDTIKP
ncbi:MAG: hypothetical protein Q9220_005980 [cf. Caloplaca sp. 1 TL-2023]